MRTNSTTAALVVATVIYASMNAEAAPKHHNAYYDTIAAQISTNIMRRMASKEKTRKSSVRELAKPENFALLKSKKAKDAAKKRALQQQIVDALMLDEEGTEEGRIKWHGRYKSQRVDLEKKTATFVHEDGTEYTVKFSRPNLADEIEKANGRLLQPPMTNGIPRALAMARLRRYNERINPVSNVVESVTATKANRPKL